MRSSAAEYELSLRQGFKPLPFGASAYSIEIKRADLNFIRKA
jgi:hypothetical protein